MNESLTDLQTLNGQKLHELQQWQQLLQSYPTANDWLQLMYGYQPLKAHDLRKLHQIQAMLADENNKSWNVIDQAIMEEMNRQLEG